MPSAAVVIIGNEILTGKFADENGPFLIKRLRALGCDLVRIAVIPDDVDVIAAEVARCAKLADRVITTGGVGPTHDDVTFSGVAAAFGLDLELRGELVEIMQRFSGRAGPSAAPGALNEAALRMARVPVGCELHFSPGVAYPVIWCRNVAILPGVPKLVVAKFEAIAHLFIGPEVHTARVYVNQNETAIAADLDATVADFPGVDFGSYPRWGEGPFKVILTLESRDPHDLARAVVALQARMERLGALVPADQVGALAASLAPPAVASDQDVS